MPKGFEPIAGKNNGTSQSVASAYSIVKSGDTFVLYFDMNVLKQTKVGGYNTSLILKYTKINQIGQLVSTIDVPFRLTGKVILDVVSEKNQLIPSTFNPLKIFIQNKGSTSAAGVIATITSITSGSGITSSNTQVHFQILVAMQEAVIIILPIPIIVQILPILKHCNQTLFPPPLLLMQ